MTDTIFTGITTYIDKLFIWLGVSEKLSGLFALIAIIIIYLLYTLSKSFYNKYKTRKASKDLAPYYTEHDVKRATKYFIPTNWQNISPTKEEEPSIANKYIARAKEELIPFFINNIFQGKKESDKFYLILADSGMGKTTFLINLYMKYNSIFRKSKYDMKMLPFGREDIIQRIKDIADNQDKAKNTILLLDAFDEYKGLIPTKISDGLTDDERFRKLLDEIFDITKDFRNVIITSRTQYFPAQEESPYELKIPCFGKVGFHKLSKLYLSPFDEKDIKKYLNKKFGIITFWNYKKKRKAKKITNSDSFKLMVRPMLLAYIDLLVDEDRNYISTFDIYDTLVKKWIEREGTKRKYDKEVREQFKLDLLKFSKLVAIHIYKSGEYSKGIEKNVAQDICEKHNINLEGYEITGQSLLTRDVANNWKFAHKSIYEFFIAENAIEDVCFGFHLDITSLDMTKKFIREKSKYSSLYFFNYSLVSNSDNCYISKFVVSETEFNLIMGIIDKKYFVFKQKQFSKSEAILYCNKLNEKFGYKIRYNENGKLLDEHNNRIGKTNIKGFIFPRIYDIGTTTSVITIKENQAYIESKEWTANLLDRTMWQSVNTRTTKPQKFTSVKKAIDEGIKDNFTGMKFEEITKCLRLVYVDNLTKE